MMQKKCCGSRTARHEWWTDRGHKESPPRDDIGWVLELSQRQETSDYVTFSFYVILTYRVCLRAEQCITVALRESCLRGGTSHSHHLGHQQSNWCEGEWNQATSKRRQGAPCTPGLAGSGSYVEPSTLPGSCGPGNTAPGHE